MSNYMFEAQPRPVQSGTKTKTATKAKYRDPADALTLPKSNIHFDKRVVRGNTYAAAIPDGTLQLQPPAPVRAVASRGKPSSSSLAARRRILGETAPQVPGRTHMLVQTDDYLEELVDQVFEQDSGTQTDALEDLPAPPVFMPKPVGEDMGTMIEPGELFDFELGVQPLLEVLVGKSLEQALLEVLEEEELARLRAQRSRFEQERNQIMTEAQRMEAQSMRHHAEKERRLAQERERLAREKEVARKAAARTAARSFLSGLQSGVVANLAQAGHLYDPIQREVESVFMPWLLGDALTRLQLVSLARGEVDALIRDAVGSMQQQVLDKRRADEEAAAARQAKLDEEARQAEEARRAAREAEQARLDKEAAEAEEAARREEQGSQDEDGEVKSGGEDEEEEEDEEE